jgi:hypothetical protein
LRAQKFLRDLAASPPEHQLVLDDGACLLEALSCKRHALQSLSIVEQTTRGLIKIDENAALEAPVVNVVGSDPKKYLEPPFPLLGRPSVTSCCAAWARGRGRGPATAACCWLWGHRPAGGRLCQPLAGFCARADSRA